MLIIKETKLKKRIMEKGLKQSFIAKLVDISETTLSKIATGKIKPTYLLAQKIATVLDCKPDDIFFENNNLYETKDNK